MRRMIDLVFVGAVVFIGPTLWADIYFEPDSFGQNGSNHAYIYEGDYYVYAEADFYYDVAEEPSIIDMFGGKVDDMLTFAFSTANINGGLTENLETFDRSTINLSGGEVLDLYAYGQSEITIIGGTVEWLSLSSGSQALLLEGDVTNLNADSFSTVDVYGYDLIYDSQYNYDRTRQQWEGLLTGFWQDRTPFSITTWDEETYNHMVLHDLGPLPSAPEPGTLLLLGLGAALLRRRR